MEEKMVVSAPPRCRAGGVVLVAALMLVACSGGGGSSTPSGMTRVTVSDAGFSVALPSSWERFDLTRQTVATIRSTLERSYPALAASMSGKAQSALAQGAKLLAFDPKGKGINANVSVSSLPSPDFTEATVTSQVVPVLKRAGARDIAVAEVTVGGRRALRVRAVLDTDASSSTSTTSPSAQATASSSSESPSDTSAGAGTAARGTAQTTQYYVSRGADTLLVSFLTPTGDPTPARVIATFRIN